MTNFEVIFDFEGNKISIQCKEDEKFKDICLKFANKENIHIDECIFLCHGNNLDLEKKLEEIITNEEKERKKMIILVYNQNTTILGRKQDEGITESKQIICYDCKELCLLSIVNYKVRLYGCKNGHIRNNIFLDDFKNTQLINESKIKCSNSNCNKNKNNSYQKKFFFCLECNQNLCALCNSVHNTKHKVKVIDYDRKNFICKNDNYIFDSYCKDCKSNLCILCPKHDNAHEIVEYKHILPNKEKINEMIIELRGKINKFNKIILEIIEKLQKVKEKMEIFYKINYDIFKNYENQNINYEIIQNINGIIDNIQKNSIDEIINDNNKLSIKAMNILEIYHKMFNKEKIDDIKIDKTIKKNNEKLGKKKSNEIQKSNPKRKSTINLDSSITKNQKMLTKEKNDKNENKFSTKRNSVNVFNEIKFKKKPIKVKKDLSDDNKRDEEEILGENEINLFYNIENEKKIKIFSDTFVQRFYGKSSITFEKKTMDISEYIDITENMRKKKILKVKLKINNIKDLSYMFYKCKSLISLSDNSTIDTSKVEDMSYLFYDCYSLSSVPCIYKWDTIKVESMKYMFYDCVSLKELPDISNWRTDNLKDMSSMFKCCYNLEKLPNISNWNTSNVNNMEETFFSCEALTSLPDISRWDVSNVLRFSSMFNLCKKLKYLPDISLWNIEKAEFKYQMFDNCESLKSPIPDKFKA